MKKNQIVLSSLLVLSSFFNSSQILYASTALSISNAGFEALSVADGSWIAGVIPDWAITPAPVGGEAGTFHPFASSQPGYFISGAPEGQNTAYNQSSVISQVLSDALAANTTYTLQVEVGTPLAQTSTGYSVQLLASGVVLAEDNSTLPPPQGTFATSTVVFNALSGNPYLGQALEIRLSSGTGWETDFDNVRLVATATPVPIPAAVWLFGSALASFCFIGKRHTKRVCA